jgi:hypothetical protein
MASIYDAFADSCGALAARAKSESDKVRLLQLADQWRTVPADRQGPGKKPPAPVAPASDIANRVTLHARPVRQHSVSGADMQKSAIEEIKELKARLESMTEEAKTEALDKASEAINVLRALGLDNDTILKELGRQGPSQGQRKQGRKPAER